MMKCNGLEPYDSARSRMKSSRATLNRIGSVLLVLIFLIASPDHSAFAKKKKKHKPTPTPTPTATPTPTPSASEAARFLTQSTFGATNSQISQVQQSGLSNFLDQQFSTPATPTLPRVDAAT